MNVYESILIPFSYKDKLIGCGSGANSAGDSKIKVILLLVPIGINPGNNIPLLNIIGLYDYKNMIILLDFNLDIRNYDINKKKKVFRNIHKIYKLSIRDYYYL